MLNEKITALTASKDLVHLKSEGGLSVAARIVVITSPLPQTLELLRSLGEISELAPLKQVMARVVYDPCVALMGFFDGAELPLSSLPVQSSADVISFLADNHSKGLATANGALTVHLSPEASRGMFTAHDLVIADFVCHQLKQLFGLNKVSRPDSFEIQRWRYASPQVTLDKPFLELHLSNAGGSRIIFAGEAFGGPKIEGAFLSGHAVAHRILSL